MWAALSWRAIWLGLAVGSLVAGVTFGIGYLISAAFPGLPRGLVLTLSIMVGLISGGLTAGRIAPGQGRFHGSLTGLGMALVVVVVARLGGSPAPTGQVLWLALLAILLGGLAGWFGERFRSGSG